jgi:hypothetical protein
MQRVPDIAVVTVLRLATTSVFGRPEVAPADARRGAGGADARSESPLCNG